MHHYAFVQKDVSPIPFYDRTFPDARTARQWAKQKVGRFVATTLPPRYWY
jgi:hypothetical protein